MEKTNQVSVKKNMINDKILLKEARENAISKSQERYGTHKKYYAEISNWYYNIELFLNELIMGKDDADINEFIDYLLNTELSRRQIEDYFDLRFNPLYKRVIGMASLQKLYELEEYISEREDEDLDFAITNKGKTVNYYGKKVNAVKTIDEIGSDITELATEINYLKEEGKISQEECRTLQKSLFDIYEYYSSVTTGEQLSFNKISDEEYSNLEKDAKIHNITMEKRLRDYLREKKQNFDFIQSLQEESNTSNKQLIRK